MELSWQRPEEDWTGVSHAKLAAWLVFYTLFLLHAVTNNTGFLILDHVNLVIHEAGHFFFGWFGNTIGILGGTLGELLVPLLIAAYFFWHRDTAGTSFAAFWFFENFLYIGTYMADARSLALPLVGSCEHDWELLFGQWGLLAHDRTIGGATRDLVGSCEHDWELLFGQWGLLAHDRTIGGATRDVGWLGMLATAAWLAWMSWHNGDGGRRGEPWR